MLTLIPNRQHTEAAMNLALEEYCVQNLDAQGTNYLILYANAPCVVVGKNQNVLEEINYHYTQAQGIEIVRRQSGGGAVYHDLGNLNFATISQYAPEKMGNYPYFNAPILQALQAMGVPASHNQRNDMVAQGYKISGNAQQSTKKNILSHGTLLFDADLGVLKFALNPSLKSVQSYSLKSVRSSVKNIKDFLPQIPNTQAFRQELLLHIGIDSVLELSSQQWQEIEHIAQKKYRTWAWNFAKSPECSLQKSHNQYSVRMVVAYGCIASVAFLGVESEQVAELMERALVGVQFRREAIAEALQPVVVSPHFFEQMMALLY